MKKWKFRQKKSARTSQKEEEVGELPRAIEDTGGRRSIHNVETATGSYTAPAQSPCQTAKLLPNKQRVVKKKNEISVFLLKK